MYLESDNNIEKAIMFANDAAAVTVKHVGVYAPTLEEINEDCNS
jgi:bifunctional ADP-heptose synthase (sugar kinase/adenylyltransferase)